MGELLGCMGVRWSRGRGTDSHGSDVSSGSSHRQAGVDAQLELNSHRAVLLPRYILVRGCVAQPSPLGRVNRFWGGFCAPVAG